MKNRIMIAVALLALSAGALALAQQGEPTGQKTLASTMNVYVFPTEGQDAQQQSKDEAECYSWAVQNTGTDPFDLAKQASKNEEKAQQAQEDAKKTGKGSGARGAVGGAAMGALIGEIADDDPGKGAAYGAAAGAIAGRRRGRAQRAQAEQQAQQQAQKAQKATAEQLTNFKKAFSVCLEAKKYMVKY